MRIETWNIEEQTGYTPITTFYEDFSIADNFGEKAIQETFDNAFENWKEDYKFLTELVMALNWKIWRWYQYNESYGRLYDKLWRKADSYAVHHLKGKELDYFYTTTD